MSKNKAVKNVIFTLSEAAYKDFQAVLSGSEGLHAKYLTVFGDNIKNQPTTIRSAGAAMAYTFSVPVSIAVIATATVATAALQPARAALAVALGLPTYALLELGQGAVDQISVQLGLKDPTQVEKESNLGKETENLLNSLNSVTDDKTLTDDKKQTIATFLEENLQSQDALTNLIQLKIITEFSKSYYSINNNSEASVVLLQGHLRVHEVMQEMASGNVTETQTNELYDLRDIIGGDHFDSLLRRTLSSNPDLNDKIAQNFSDEVQLKLQQRLAKSFLASNSERKIAKSLVAEACKDSKGASQTFLKSIQTAIEVKEVAGVLDQLINVAKIIENYRDLNSTETSEEEVTQKMEDLEIAEKIAWQAFNIHYLVNANIKARSEITNSVESFLTTEDIGTTDKINTAFSQAITELRKADDRLMKADEINDKIKNISGELETLNKTLAQAKKLEAVKTLKPRTLKANQLKKLNSKKNKADKELAKAIQAFESTKQISRNFVSDAFIKGFEKALDKNPKEQDKIFSSDNLAKKINVFGISDRDEDDSKKYLMGAFSSLSTAVKNLNQINSGQLESGSRTDAGVSESYSQNFDYTKLSTEIILFDEIKEFQNRINQIKNTGFSVKTIYQAMKGKVDFKAIENGALNDATQEGPINQNILRLANLINIFDGDKKAIKIATEDFASKLGNLTYEELDTVSATINGLDYTLTSSGDNNSATQRKILDQAVLAAKTAIEVQRNKKIEAELYQSIADFVGNDEDKRNDALKEIGIALSLKLPTPIGTEGPHSLGEADKFIANNAGRVDLTKTQTAKLSNARKFVAHEELRVALKQKIKGIKDFKELNGSADTPPENNFKDKENPSKWCEALTSALQDKENGDNRVIALFELYNAALNLAPNLSQQQKNDRKEDLFASAFHNLAKQKIAEAGELAEILSNKLTDRPEIAHAIMKGTYQGFAMFDECEANKTKINFQATNYVSSSLEAYLPALTSGEVFISQVDLPEIIGNSVLEGKSSRLREVTREYGSIENSDKNLVECLLTKVEGGPEFGEQSLGKDRKGNERKKFIVNFKPEHPLFTFEGDNGFQFAKPEEFQDSYYTSALIPMDGEGIEKGLSVMFTLCTENAHGYKAGEIMPEIVRINDVGEVEKVGYCKNGAGWRSYPEFSISSQMNSWLENSDFEVNAKFNVADHSACPNGQHYYHEMSSSDKELNYKVETRNHTNELIISGRNPSETKFIQGEPEAIDSESEKTLNAYKTLVTKKENKISFENTTVKNSTKRSFWDGPRGFIQGKRVHNYNVTAHNDALRRDLSDEERLAYVTKELDVILRSIKSSMTDGHHIKPKFVKELVNISIPDCNDIDTLKEVLKFTESLKDLGVNIGDLNISLSDIRDSDQSTEICDALLRGAGMSKFTSPKTLDLTNSNTVAESLKEQILNLASKESPQLSINNKLCESLSQGGNKQALMDLAAENGVKLTFADERTSSNTKPTRNYDIVEIIREAGEIKFNGTAIKDFKPSPDNGIIFQNNHDIVLSEDELEGLQMALPIGKHVNASNLRFATKGDIDPKKRFNGEIARQTLESGGITLVDKGRVSQAKPSSHLHPRNESPVKKLSDLGNTELKRGHSSAFSIV